MQVVHAKQSFHEVKETLKQFKSCSLDEVSAEKLESVRSARSWDKYHHRLDISTLREMKRQGSYKIYRMEQFFVMFKKLKAFEQEHKHTKVRELRDSTPDVIALCGFCDRYRRIYHRLTNGKKSSYQECVLTPEKFLLLDSIGFNWDGSTIQEDINIKTFPEEDETKAYFKSWMKRYTNLKNFVGVNGRYPLPSEKGSEEEALNKWMKKQKHYYHNQFNDRSTYVNGRSKSVISQNRILKLMELPQWKFGVHAMARNRGK